jgi:hypothetical protein
MKSYMKSYKKLKAKIVNDPATHNLTKAILVLAEIRDPVDAYAGKVPLRRYRTGIDGSESANE